MKKRMRRLLSLMLIVSMLVTSVAPAMATDYSSADAGTVEQSDNTSQAADAGDLSTDTSDGVDENAGDEPSLEPGAEPEDDPEESADGSEESDSKGGKDSESGGTDGMYDLQPETLEEVQEWIDLYVDSDYEETAKPYWEQEVDAELIPEGWECEFVDDDEDFGASYYTLRSLYPPEEGDGDEAGEIDITAANVTVALGDESFDLLDGVSATDEDGEDISSQVVVLDDDGFDVETLGRYLVAYAVLDEDEAILSAVKRAVTVSEELPEAPEGEYPLLDAEDLYLLVDAVDEESGAAYYTYVAGAFLKGAAAFDEEGNNVTGLLEITGYGEFGVAPEEGDLLSMGTYTIQLAVIRDGEVLMEGSRTITIGTGIMALPGEIAFTVNWYDWNGRRIESQSIAPGAAATAPTPSRPDYEHIGWSMSDEDEEPLSEQELNAMISSVTQDLRFYAVYRATKTKVITVKYLLLLDPDKEPNGEEGAVYFASPYVREFPAGASQTITVKSPTSTGYALRDPATHELFDIDLSLYDDDTTLYVYYVASEGSVEVIYRLQSLDDSNRYDVDEIVPKNVRAGDVVGSDGRTYDGFRQVTFEKRTMHGGVNDPIYVDFDRLNYAIRFDTNGGTYFGPFARPAGTDISADLPVPGVSFWRNGHTFDRWEITPEGDWNTGELPLTMPGTDVYAKAIWTPDETASYTVRYWLEQIDDTPLSLLDEYVLNDYKFNRGYDYVGQITFEGDVGTTPPMPTEAEDKANVSWPDNLFDEPNVWPPVVYIDHAYKNEELTANANVDIVIEADGSTVVNIYYDRVIHSIELSVADSTGKDSTGNYLEVGGDKYDLDNPYRVTAKYGDNIAAQWPHWGPVHGKGFTFISWFAAHHNGNIAGKRTYMIQELARGYIDDPLVVPSTYTDEVVYEWNMFTKKLPIDSKRYVEPEKYVLDPDLNARSITASSTSQPGSGQIPGFERNWYHFWGSEVDWENRNITFYYYRDRYTLEFYNGNELLLSVDESYPEDHEDVPFGEEESHGVHYDKPLAGYDKHELLQLTDADAPDEYKGYQFAGWYIKGDDPMRDVDFDFTTATMPAYNLRLDAKWVKPEKTVIFHVEDEFGVYQEVSRETVSMFDTVTEPPVPSPPSSKTGYEFVGWYRTETPAASDVEYMFDFPVDDDIKLYAQFRSKTNLKYTVEYYNKDENRLVWDYIGYGAQGEEVFAYGFDQSGLDGHNLNGYFVNKYEQSKVLTENEDENVIRFYYEKRDTVEYTIHYRETGTEKTLAPSVTETTPKSVETLYAKDIDGYWTSTPEIILYLAIEGNEVTFYYNANTLAKYTVEHYLQKVDPGKDGYPAQSELTAAYIDERTGPVNTWADAEIRNYTGFTHDPKIGKLTGRIVTVTEDGDGLVLQVYYKRNNYTVTYESNSGSAVPQDSVYFEALVNKPADPVRAGHNFAGWYTDDVTFTSPWDFANETMPAGNVTLYAKWVHDGSYYNITYMANDRGKGGPTDGATTYPGLTDTVRDLDGAKIEARYDGWNFTGWNTLQNGSGESYMPGYELQLNSNVTLWAQWEHNGETYYVYYLPNGGQGGDWDSGLIPGDPYTVRTQAQANVTRDGSWKFLGWTTKDGSGKTYQAGELIDPLTSSLFLYAEWQYTGERITITYDANRGEGSYEGKAIPGSEYTVVSNVTAQIYRKGHEFVEWNDKADGSGKWYQEGTKAEFTEDVTLYAQWKHDGKTYVKVIYDANKGVGEASFNVVPGEDHQVLSSSAVSITRLGHSFVNWNSAANGSGKSYVAGNTVTPLNDDIILHAQWKYDEKTKVTLTYDANGGTGEHTVRNIVPGESVSVLSDSAAGIKRKGHDFLGWNTKADGTGKTYTEDELIKVDENTTIYAQWKWDETTYVTLSYSANGGTGSHTVDKIIPGETRAVIDPADANSKISRYGFDFLGWNSEADDSGIPYAPGAPVKVDDDTTLFAQWEHDGESGYNVYYMPNGGTGNHIVKVIPGGEHTLVKLSDTTITRPGYEFDGWNTAAAGTGTAYKPGDTIVVNGNTILYAQWYQNITYQVTYDANGGQGGHIGLPIVAGQTDTVLTLNQTGITHNGHRFDGWQDADGKAYAPGTPITMNSNVTLYAQWTWDGKTLVNITYNANGGTGGGNGPSLKPGEPDEILSPTDARLNVKRSHYNFLGWTTNADGTGTTYQPGQKIPLHEGMTLYAQWDWDGTYVYVIYNSNGGTDAGSIQMGLEDEVERVQVKPGDSHTVLSADDFSFARRGHEFTGWGTQNVEEPPLVYTPGTVITVDDDVYLYGCWRYDGTTQVTITYDANGGTGTNDVKVVPGRSVSLRNAISHGIERKGYKFVGWALDANGPVAYTPGNGTVYFKTNNDVTLYAIWEVDESVKITVNYHANDGVGNDYPDIDQRPGSSYTVLAPTASVLNYSKYGFNFTGWNTEADGSGITYSAGQVIAIEGEDIDLYAQWKHDGKTYYQVYYMPSGGSGYAIDKVIPGSSYTIRTGAESTITKEGYVIAYWNTNTSGTGTDYAGGDVITPTGHMNLYAQWVGSDVTYKVAYDANGGSGGYLHTGISPVGRYTVRTAAQTGVSLEGYALADWNTAPNGLARTYEAGEKIILKGDTDLYAQWAPVEGYKFTVTYDSNGADGPKTSHDGGGYTHNKPHTVLSDAEAGFSHSTATFLRWNTRADGKGTSYAAGSTIPMTEHIKLYAQWQAIAQDRDITYHSNLGANSRTATEHNDANDPYDVRDYDVITGLTSTEAFKFTGWNTAADGTGDSYAPTDILPPSGNITLYAQWKYDGYSIARITYMPNTANGGVGAPKIVSQAAGPHLLLDLPDVNYTHSEGKEFKGWSTDMGSLMYDTAGTPINAGGNMTLYAIWQ